MGSDGPGGWWILDEPEIHLSTNVVVPDLAGWRRELIPNLPTAKAYFEIVPTSPLFIRTLFLNSDPRELPKKLPVAAV